MGYEIEQIVFASPDIDDFKCRICFDVVKDPVVLKCSFWEHLLCRDCFSSRTEGSNICPLDRYPFEASGLVAPDRFFRNQYDRLQIKCDHAEV